jgi:ribosomal protein L20A (L18A)
LRRKWCRARWRPISRIWATAANREQAIEAVQRDLKARYPATAEITIINVRPVTKAQAESDAYADWERV